MKQLQIMLKPVSARCNLRCGYCFYADVSDHRSSPAPAAMTIADADAMLDSVARDLQSGDEVIFSFQGGEPTLAGLEWFRDFTARAKALPGVRVGFTLQTNGLLLDDAWCAFLRENRFLVGLSWDILPEHHDAARGRGTNDRVVSALARLRSFGVEHNVLCTLTPDIARQPRRVWDAIVETELEYVQFTPCLDFLDGGSTYALNPALFFSFYDELFRLWYADFSDGKYRSVKLFDDIVNLLAFGTPTACGIDGQCRCQLVAEADGSVYPCDFYCVDPFRLGDLRREPPSALLRSPAAAAFLASREALPQQCSACEFRGFCGGGCRRMRREIYCGGDFCGYRELLRAHREEFRRIAALQL